MALEVMVCAFNPRAQEAQPGRSLGIRGQFLSTEQVPRQDPKQRNPVSGGGGGGQLSLTK